jgi:SSS family transporter
VGFSTIDYIIVIVYLSAVTIFGIVQRGKQRSAKDYFLSYDNIPWWVVCFSIVAAETSALTFISIPGLAYISNMGFLQVTVGYLLGRIAISYFLLPAYYRGELSTAYAYLEQRFGKKTRSFASIVFIFTRIAAEGVRLFASAIPIKFILGIDIATAIILLAIVSIAYTFVGGVRGAIWVDALQMLIYIGGALCAVGVLVYQANGFGESLAPAISAGKTMIISAGFDRTFFSNPYTLIGGVLGGMFLSMASHGTDQLIIQRVLATKSLEGSKKALITSGVIVIFQFALFLIIGLMLYGFYKGSSVADLGLLRSDEIFPMFIVSSLPHGISGFIVAGLVAVALASLGGSITSLSSATVLDLYQPLTGRTLPAEKEVLYARLFSLVWAIMLVGSAFFFMNTTQTVVELALSIASFTYGGLLGTFLLGLINKKATQEDALAGFVAGILGMISIILLKLVAWTWFTLIGVVITLTVGTLMSRLTRGQASVK